MIVNLSFTAASNKSNVGPLIVHDVTYSVDAGNKVIVWHEDTGRVEVFTDVSTIEVSDG